MAVKVSDLTTESAPASTDVLLIADPTTGVAKKITVSALKTYMDGLGGGGDTTAPVVVSATATSGNLITIVFSESVTVTTSGWSFKLNGGSWAISSVTGSGATWTFTMATSAISTDTILRSYSSTTGNTVDSSANELVTFTDQAVTNSIPSNQLATPTLTATVISSTQIDLSWTNVANESSYQLERSTDNTNWTQIGGTIAANTTTYSATGLTASTLYYFRVKAVGDGITYSDSGYGTDSDTTSAYQAESSAFFAANTSLNSTQKTAVDNLVTALKAIGWSKFIAVYPYVGGTASAHKWNLINPADTDAAFRLTFSGTFTHASTGVTPAGTSTYQNTHIKPNTNLTDGSVHASVYLRSNVASTTAGYEWGVIEGGTANWYFNPRRVDDTYQAYFFHGVDSQFTGASTDSRGLWTQSLLSGESALFKNSTSLATDSTLGSNTESSFDIHLSNYNFVTGEGSTREMAFASIGTGLSATEVDDLYTAVQAYQTELSRNV